MARKAKRPHPLFLDGAGKVSSVSYGVLRSTYKGRANAVTDYVAGKLMVADKGAIVWQPAAARYDVIIPTTAPTLWWEPRELWMAYSTAQLPQQRDLALVVTAYLDVARSLQDGWEQVRAWVVDELVGKRSLATTLVLHVPSKAGSAHDPHVHVIATARQALGWGWGGFARETHDEPLKELALDLIAHRARWQAGRP